jgi:hypothetical protein
MSLMVWLYLVDVASSLKFYFTFMCIVGVIVSVIMLFVGAAMHDENPSTQTWAIWRRGLSASAVAVIAGWFFSTALPSQKTLYLMMGVKTAQDIVDNPKMKETGGKVIDLINKKLDEIMGQEEAAVPKKK